MRIRLPGLAAALLTLLGTAQAQENWNAHFQATFGWQRKPGFDSPYQGPNSLSGLAEKSYSWTGTAALGLRLGTSTEAYFNPEVAQGVPLSGLLGLAGFTNGELAKTSGASLKLYRARLFVRHHVDLAGPETSIESGANQLAGSYATRRVVVTAGALSVLDLFDANAFAHDPRTQFMNWALMTHAAYDYPADSRGYTYGLAVEYIDRGWSLRAGRFAEPKEPNQLALDSRLLRHYGDQVELARDYDIADQPGTIRLLAFRTRAVMATYADALAATSGVPTLDSVRRVEHAKTGLGINVEHHLQDDLGLFARAMRADGRSETYAFTEADRSASVGVVLKGQRWGRSADTLGVALATSALSGAHRTFLARGGQTFFLGDGALNYRAERDLEVYYSIAIAQGLALTFDYQRIQNPGYNADRGPASFYALRVHWEN